MCINICLSRFAFFLGCVATLLSCKSADKGSTNSIVFQEIIPMQGNSWVISSMESTSEVVTDRGIEQWRRPEDVIGVFFKTSIPGTIQVGLKIKSMAGASKIKVSMGAKSYEVAVDHTAFDDVYVGEFQVDAPGYHRVELQGLSKAGDSFAEVSHLLIGGEVCRQPLYFVRDDFYWGRRGPSVHLSYQIPENSGDVKWFYNELTVPDGEDVIGSYFMANGFGEGYFGIQVNSITERRILFSVWSPFQTDDPTTIPDDYKIKLLAKGNAVKTGEFGNEGSGGQSYRIFSWKPGVTYCFLLKVEPSVNGSSDYSAYFKSIHDNQWDLIASFRRPHTNTYVQRPYSFLENFITETGCLSRKGTYGNQWICNTAGQWKELVSARFTADATARKESRMDYAGGVENGLFYLMNCGFFSDTTPLNAIFERPATERQPQIEFEKLPK